MKMEYAGLPWVELVSLGVEEIDLPEGTIVEFDNGWRRVVGGMYVGGFVLYQQVNKINAIRYQLPPWSK